MSFPASFPATNLGYNAYVKSLGFDPKDSNVSFWVMGKAPFMAVERRSLDERLSDFLDQYSNKSYLNQIEDFDHSVNRFCQVVSCLMQAISDTENRDLFIRMSRVHREYVKGNDRVIVESLINEVGLFLNV